MRFANKDRRGAVACSIAILTNTFRDYGIQDCMKVSLQLLLDPFASQGPAAAATICVPLLRCKERGCCYAPRGGARLTDGARPMN